MALRDPQLGTRIRAARLEKGWKQKELAFAVGVEPTTVSRWERAANTPDMETLMQIAEALGKPIAYFTAHLDGPALLEVSGAELASVRLEERVEALQESVNRVERLLERIAKQK